MYGSNRHNQQETNVPIGQFAHLTEFCFKIKNIVNLAASCRQNQGLTNLIKKFTRISVMFLVRSFLITTANKGDSTSYDD